MVEGVALYLSPFCKNSIHDIAVDEKGTLYLVDTNLGVLAIKPKKN